jgi:hypothetical protein
MQVDFSLRGIGLEILDNARMIFLDLLLDLDRAPTIDEMTGFKGREPQRSSSP